MTAAADRHLLFGLLALQIGIINQGQLLAAFQAWTLDKSRVPADHLAERAGDLMPPSGQLLEAAESMVHLDIKPTAATLREEPGRGFGRQVDAGEPGADRRPGRRGDARPRRLGLERAQHRP